MPLRSSINSKDVASSPPLYAGMFSYCLSVRLSVCVSVQAITFKCLDIETSFLAWWYILTISRSSLSIKVIGSRSKSL